MWKRRRVLTASYHLNLGGHVLAPALVIITALYALITDVHAQAFVNYSSSTNCSNQCQFGYLSLPYSVSGIQESQCSLTCRVDRAFDDLCIKSCTYNRLLSLSGFSDLLLNITINSISAKQATVRWSWLTLDLLDQLEDVTWIVQLRSWQKDWLYVDQIPQANLSSSYGTSVLPDLIPYNQYEVRITMTVAGSPVYISKSVAFNTTASSNPAPASSLIRQPVPLVGTSYAVCWDVQSSELYSPLRHYAVQLNVIGAVQPVISAVTQNQCYGFGVLRPGPDYTLTVQTVTDAGIGKASRHFSVVGNPVAALDTSLLVFANATHIFHMSDPKDFAVVQSPSVLFSPDDGEIIALTGKGTNELFVALSAGTIVKISDLRNERVATILKKDIRGLKSLAVHPFDSYFYFSFGNQVSACSVQNCRTVSVIDNGNVQAIVVDYINGFLYFTTSNHELYRRPLNFATGVKSTFIYARYDQDMTAFPIWIDFGSLSLIFADNSSLISVDLVNGGFAEIRASDGGASVKKPYGNATAIAGSVRDQYLYVLADTSCSERKRGGCLFGEEEGQLESSNKRYVNAYLLPESYGFLTAMTTLEEPLKPRKLEAPDTISTLFDDSSVHVQWSRPKTYPFQAALEWRSLTYQVELHRNDLLENRTIVSDNSNECFFSGLMSSANYTVRVQACYSSLATVCSDTIEAIGSTSQNEQTAILLLARRQQVLLTDTTESSMLSHVESSLSTSTNSSIISVLPIYGEAIQYVVLTSSSEVYVARKMDNMLTWPVSNATIYAMAYNAIGNEIYYIADNWVFRSTVDGVRRQTVYPFLSQTSVRSFKVLPNRALLVIATEFNVRAMVFAGGYYQTYYECDLRKCGSVEALATNVDTDTIWFVVRQKDGVTLHTVAWNETNTRTIALPSTFPRIKDLWIFAKKIYFLTSTGRLGVTDMGSRDISYFALNEITAMSFYQPSDKLKQIRLPRVVSLLFNETDRHATYKLVWKLEDGYVANGSQSIYYQVQAVGLSDQDPKQFNVADRTELIVADVPGSKRITFTILPISVWGAGEPFVQSVITAAQVPSAPKHLKIVVKHARSEKSGGLLSATLIVSWDAPEWGSRPLGYQLNCQKTSSTSPQQPLDPISMIRPEVTEVTIENIGLNLEVSCELVAKNDKGDSPASRMSYANTSVVTAPQQFAALSSDGADLVLLKLNDTRGLVADTIKLSPPAPLLHRIVTMNGMLYAVPMSRDRILDAPFDITHGKHVTFLNPTQASIPRDAQITDLAMDWVGRRLFFVTNLAGKTVPTSSTVWSYELDSTVLQVLFNCSCNVGSLVFDPFMSQLYYTVAKLNTGVATQLAGRYILSAEGALFAGPERVICASVLSAVVAASYDLYANPIRAALYFVGNGSLQVYTPGDKECGRRVSGSLKDVLANLSQISQLHVLSSQVLVFMNTGDVIVMPMEGRSKRDTTSSSYWTDGVPQIKQFTPFDDELPLPDFDCLRLPNYINSSAIHISRLTPTTVKIVVDPYISANVACQNVSQPQTEYHARMRTERDVVDSIFEKSFNGTIVADLKADSNYTLQVTRSNFYSKNDSWSEPILVRAARQAVSPPTNLHVRSISPKTAMVTFNVPDNANIGSYDFSVYYAQAIGDTSTMPVSSLKTERPIIDPKSIKCPQDPCSLQTSNLMAGTTYVVKVLVISTDNQQATSDPIPFTTWQDPWTVQVVSGKVNATTAILQCTLVATEKEQTDRIKSATLEYRLSAAADSTPWVKKQIYPNDFKQTGGAAQLVTLSDLRPVNWYNVRMHIVYLNASSGQPFDYIYLPPNAIFNTSSPVPSAPRNVGLKTDNAGQVVVYWDEPIIVQGDALIQAYVIEYRKAAADPWTRVNASIVPAPGQHSFQWTAPAGLHMDVKFLVRVAAQNNVGLGAFGVPQSSSSLNDTRTVAIIAACAGAGALILIIVVLVVACRRHGRKGKKGTDVRAKYFVEGSTVNTTIDNIATLRTIPPEELAALPHVPRSCITVHRMLGKGAFGEVFEGLAYNLPKYGPKSLRVAIKTLRPGSTEIERVKFLKEALIMSNFNHENIVRLLGVCLDSEPQWIIIELMEAGDLLSYLRTVRPTDIMPSQVSLSDLISIAEDVCRGCAYLEKIHHVHRDLAARNCLVSSRDPRSRRVKIADFGLARDVYEDDYYRVEGQGLLPVRWMAPESMVDGVFTLKTDIWAFGVLLWEVMTLGQQPYQGRSNWDVINYVRIGGSLQAPDHCPDKIYDVMRLCWSFEAEDRPTFSELSMKLTTLASEPELSTESPFPPIAARGSWPTASLDRQAGSDGQIQIFATEGSAKFKRTDATHSLKPEDRRKKPFFRSFGRSKSPPAEQPPSKATLEAQSLRLSADSGRTPRPDSSASSGIPSFTTSSYGYEVPLLKNMTTTEKQHPHADALSSSSSAHEVSLRPERTKLGHAEYTNRAFVHSHPTDHDAAGKLSKELVTPTDPRYMPGPQKSLNTTPESSPKTNPKSLGSKPRPPKVPPPQIPSNRGELSHSARAAPQGIHYIDLDYSGPDNYEAPTRGQPHSANAGALPPVLVVTDSTASGRDNQGYDRSPLEDRQTTPIRSKSKMVTEL